MYYSKSERINDAMQAVEKAIEADKKERANIAFKNGVRYTILKLQDGWSVDKILKEVKVELL